MKKTLFLCAIAALAMTFVGCFDGLPVPEDPNAPKTIFKDATIKNMSGYGDEGEIIKEDDLDIVHVKPAGNYAKWRITLKTPVDISGKKIKTTAKFAEYAKGDNTFKIAFFSDDTHGSEIDNTTAGIGSDDAAFKTEYTAYTSTAVADDTMNVVWTTDNSIEKADFTKIKYIEIVPQTGSGEVWIKDIEFVD